MNVGEKIRSIARQKGVKMKELARLRGVTPQSVSIDLGKVKLSTALIHDYARVLDINVNDILEIEENESKKSDKTSNDIDLLKENIRLSKEVNFLWRVVAMNGIKIEPSQLNFNSGVHERRFADFF